MPCLSGAQPSGVPAQTETAVSRLGDCLTVLPLNGVGTRCTRWSAATPVPRPGKNGNLEHACRRADFPPVGGASPPLDSARRLGWSVELACPSGGDLNAGAR